MSEGFDVSQFADNKPFSRSLIRLKALVLGIFMSHFYLAKYRLFIFCAVVLGFLPGCSTTQPLTAKVYAAYSLFAPSASGDTILYARVIVDGVGVSCPILTGSDESKIAMSVRGYHPDAQTASQNFPVTSCEAIISPGVSYVVSSSTLAIEAVTLNPSSVIVYGDTGCKSSDCELGKAASPFDQLAQLGVNADLILHMGDYNYRGTSGSIREAPTKIYAYDAGDGGFGGAACGFVESDYYSQNASDSGKPDRWQYWHDDFFKPAKNLLPTAPWVFNRGNHELCSRAGIGWFYFLGPGSSLEGGIPQLTCPNQGALASPAQGAANHINMIQPYTLSLEPLKLWVVDSANACDESADSPLTAQYTLQFEQLQKDETADSKPIWMVTHRPFWGVSIEKSGRSSLLSPQTGLQITPINIMMQRALQNTSAARLPEVVQLILSGHEHIFQSVSFLSSKTERPPQIVIGNSGVGLSNSPAGNYNAIIDGEAGSINQLDQYGFLTILLKADNSWSGDVLNETGSSIISCDSKNVSVDKLVCEINVPQ